MEERKTLTYTYNNKLINYKKKYFKNFEKTYIVQAGPRPKMLKKKQEYS